jgi:predicted acylesterase/phospholipase RssA
VPAGEGGRAGPAVGLALAGGGPQGAIWEIGALRALDEFLTGVDLNALDVYVGVSAGSFLAAFLANGLTPAQLCRVVLRSESGVHPFAPSTFFRPAVREWVRGGVRLPGLLAEGLLDWVHDPRRASLFGSLGRLARSIPVAVFDNEPIRRYVADALDVQGRTDDFRKLRRRLVVVAADLETGRAVRFGEDGLDHVPISLAVQASTALPGVYPTVEIEGREYVDGVLLKTLHASVALDHGVDLLLCVNPLVPVDTERAARRGAPVGHTVRELGLPAVMEQTFRTMIRSRMAVGMSSYAQRYPDSEILLVEPDPGDPDLFFRNTFSFRDRGQICLSGWTATREYLRRERERARPALARHGIRLREDLLDDPEVRFWDGIGIDPEEGRGSSARRLSTLLDRVERMRGQVT